MSAEYSGKICVVTGAVSRIGRALCGELLRHGAVVYMGDVSDAALAQMANEFNLSHPGRAFSVPTDVTTPCPGTAPCCRWGTPAPDGCT